MKKFLVAGLVAVLLTGAAGAGALQADPFDTARYDIGIKKNVEALAIVDSGQFDINMQTDEGYTLLHYAADAGNLEMVKALLARGADASLKSKAGSTPYDMASGTMVKAELAKATRAGPAPAAAGAKGPAGGNGMCAAVRAEKVNDGRSPQMRPFLRARDDIRYNHPDELALLLDDCVGANDKDQYGSTLLHIAAERDRVDAAKLLLARGANKTARDKDGKRPADYATSPEMRVLLGSASVPAAGAASSRKTECEQKYRADAALCSDTSCKMSANRRWQQCLNTGRYW